MQGLNSYFQKNRSFIIKGHENEHVVIYDAAVQGYFASDKGSLDFCAKKGYELGTFLIKRCVKEEEVQRFYSRVSFV